MTTKDAVAKISSELKRDKDYYDAYHATISLAFYDEYRKWRAINNGKQPNPKEVHEISNKAAAYFLDLFSGQIKYPDGR